MERNKISAELRDKFMASLHEAGLTLELTEKVANCNKNLAAMKMVDAAALETGTNFRDRRFGAPILETHLIVPEGYVHREYIDSFMENHRQDFFSLDSNVTDKNYGTPTVVMKPGEVYAVSVYPVLEKIKPSDCMAFLQSQNAVFLGTPGLCLFWELYNEELSYGTGYISFDTEKNLWHEGNHTWMPFIYHASDGAWEFSRTSCTEVIIPKDFIVCFTRVVA